MATSDSALLQQMDDYTVDGKYHEATDVYCRLVAAHPDSATHITTHGHPASPRRKDVLFEAWAHYISSTRSARVQGVLRPAPRSLRRLRW
jgi:hypothetical protein